MNKLKNLLTLLAPLFLLLNCEPTNQEPIPQEENEQPEVSFIPFDGLVENLFSEIDLNISDQSARSAFGKIELDSSQIKLMTRFDNTQTYTARTKESDPLNFTNLVIEEKDDLVQYYLIRYDASPEWFNTKAHHNYLDFNGTITVYDFQSHTYNVAYYENGSAVEIVEEGDIPGGRTCITVITMSDTFCSGDGHDGHASAHTDGTCDHPASSETTIELHCFGEAGTGGGGGSGGDNPDPDNPGGGGSGDGSPIYPGGGDSGDSGCGPGTVNVDGECVTEVSIENQLINLLEQDPFALIQNCDQIEDWQNLAQHTPPQEVLNKIQNLDDNYLSIIGGDWDIQYIEDAEGPVVNLDYFPVKITQLPNDPETGQTFTPGAFFNYVRTNLNTFFENNSTEFGPYNGNEAILWNSSNYLGAIMRFDIIIENDLGMIVGQQDGSVICSKQEPTIWTFTTIESPTDWNHPVSGNRQFGLQLDSDGSYTFYTKGVDRVAESSDVFFGNLPTMNSAFEGGDLLWSAFQQNLETFINNPDNGGIAQVQSPKTDRPDWDKVKDVLDGSRSISDIGCN
ncbi:MAG: hypothetical protein RIM99_12795 [Cyclobacteriaceae bacterium]